MIVLVRRALLILLVFCGGVLYAQVAADCATAIRICNDVPINGGTNNFGINDFEGIAQSGCLEKTTTGSIESNSAWYKFRTGAAGQLGFNIGFKGDEDWDFALYKTTNCASLGEPIRCNFFDNKNKSVYMGVGEDPTGNVDSVLYEDWLAVLPNEEYYLFINNFSNTNSGVSIQFTGSIFESNPFDALDCDIIENLLGAPTAACKGDSVVLNGFVENALTYNWFVDTGAGFVEISGETTSELKVENAGLYKVAVRTPDKNILSEVQVHFSEAPIVEEIMEEVFCADATSFNLKTKDVEALGEQSASSFVVSYYATEENAILGIAPLQKEFSPELGVNNIFVRLTSVENPSCYDASGYFKLVKWPPLGANIEQEEFLCVDGFINIGDTAADGSYSYSWSTGENSAIIKVSEPGDYSVDIKKEEMGFVCSKTITINVEHVKAPKIREIVVSASDIKVLTIEEGDFEYKLDDGDYQESAEFKELTSGEHTIRIRDKQGCSEVTDVFVVLGYPKFFTPNGDMANNDWQIVGLEALMDPEIVIFDRYGKLIKQMHKDSQPWDGMLHGKQMPSSDYWFSLTYINQEGVRVKAKYLQSHFSLKR